MARGPVPNVELRRIAHMLRRVEEKEFVQILSGTVVDCRKESRRISKFMIILRLFKGEEKKRQYALGRAMLAILASEAREFVLKVVEENIFECSRLNTLCRLEYFSVEASVLLDCLMRPQRQYDFLVVAVPNFRRWDIVELIKFITLHSPSEIVEKISQDEVFRGEFVVDNPEEYFSEERKKELIAVICKKLEMKIPSVSLMLFARVRLTAEFRMYEEGKTEISDFYKICEAYAKDDPAVLRLCAVLVAGKFNPLGKLFCSMIKLPFSHNPAASSFFPACMKNDALHDLACDRHSSLSDISAVREFATKMSSARDVAIAYHQNSIEGKTGCDFIVFRFHNRMFYYSVEQSKPMKVEVIKVLVKYPNIKVYVYKEHSASLYLRQHLGWKPRNVFEAKQLARQNGIRHRLEDISAALVGGQFCHRATNFCGASVPSQTALRHIDILSNVVFRFCKRFRSRTEVTGSRRGRDPRRPVEERRPTMATDRSRSWH